MKEYTEKETKFLLLANRCISTLCKHLKIPRDYIDIEIRTLPSHIGGGQEAIGDRALIFINVDCADGYEDVKRICSHEMVHVQQQYTGRLVEKGDMTLWEGHDYTDAKLFAYNMVFGIGIAQFYLDLPWEAEAYARQTALSKLLE